MLAKQVWRLISNPDSLCAQVLRSKYYPDDDILKAGPKAGSSFTWQNIVAGITTFKRGYVWRVGDGESIDIWSEPWIPSRPSRRILFPRGNAVVTKVSELICPITGMWDEELLRSLFSDIDTDRILQIPINNHGFSDFIAWNFTRHGCYTVKSGYYVQWRHQFGPNAAQLALPGGSALNPFWKMLWKLKLPSKIKKIAWRALHGLLPLKSILVNRHIGHSGQFPICMLGPKDISHLLFTCPSAQGLWYALGLTDIIEQVVHLDRADSAVLEYLI
jgi:hypothetical protein